MSKLSILYRAYPLVSKQTLIEFSNKTEMMKVCLGSLKKSLDYSGVNFDFTFISDKCSQDQVDLVRMYFSGQENSYSEILLSGAGNCETFRLQIEQACKATSEYVLILEDDYYISLTDLAINLEALEKCKIDYTTFFYSADADPAFGNMRCELVNLIDDVTAIELPCTTLTFFARRTTLIEDKSLFLTFSDGNHDSSLWLRLTGNFILFLKNISRPLFYKNLKLYLSIIRRYIRFIAFKPDSRRRLYFIGDFSSVHLDSGSTFNENSIKYKLRAALRDDD